MIQEVFKIAGNSRTLTPTIILRSKDGSAKITQSVGEVGVKGRRASIETGWYPTNDGGKICLSSQIGCQMRCAFCATGQPFEYWPGRVHRLLRNLTSIEIVDQARNALELVPYDSSDLTFAFMGMGEPFSNLKAVKQSIHGLAALCPESRVTLSTIGSNLKAVMDLAEEVAASTFSIPVRLHLSIHGSRDQDRLQIMPQANSLLSTIEVAEHFARRTGSDVKLNYVLIAGKNDSVDDALRIVSLLKGRKGLRIKLSTLNEILDHQHPPEEVRETFLRVLKENRVPVYLFKSMGLDIKAGCGELAKGRVIRTILAMVKSDDGRILALQRRSGRWSIVSGHIELGERPTGALVRELREEIGLDLTNPPHCTAAVSAYSPFFYVSHSQPFDIYEVHAFAISLNQSFEVRLRGQEHRKFRWVAGLANLETEEALGEELRFMAQSAARVRRLSCAQLMSHSGDTT